MKDNREKLENNALNAVQVGGLSSISFRTLADEIGIKSSSVHYHFPDKSSLARVLIQRYSDEFFGELKTIENKRWGLRRKIKAFIEIFETVSENKKICLCGMLAAEIEALDTDNRTLLVNYFLETEKWIIQLLDQHQDELASDLSSGVLAKSLLSGLEGALLLDRVVDNNQRLRAQKELFLTFIN